MTRKKSETLLYRKKKGIGLFFTVLVAISIFIIANYYTLKVANSILAYSQGESIYSKGQKEACIHLILYAEDGSLENYNTFQAQIAIPHNDQLALGLLMNPQDGDANDKIRKHFLAANNHPDDIDNLIWLFRNFRRFQFMDKAVQIWRDAKVDIDSLMALGNEMHDAETLNQILSDPITKQRYIASIESISSQINEKELQFSSVLNEASRKMSRVVLWINIVMVAFIFGILSWICYRVIRDMARFQHVLQSSNAELIDTNQKLDQFIYATSHDLKAPVNNMQGLVYIAKMHAGEGDTFQSNVLDKMEFSLQSLTGTMQDIENMIQIDHDSFQDFEYVNLAEMINLILLDNLILQESQDFELIKKLEVPSIYFSKQGMQSVLFNLISNAIRYRSPDRKLSIRIESRNREDGVMLSIRDNGLGIDMDKHGAVLFDMFRRFHDHVNGSGLGLYVVRRILERNDATISVDSTPDVGTIFKLFFKKRI